MNPLRWDDDERGHGVADGRRVEPGASELLQALREPDWVAEGGDDHLLPHLRRACERRAVPLRLEGSSTDTDGAFLVDLTWLGRPEDVRAVRSAVYKLVGEVAESATYIRQRRDEPVVSPSAATASFTKWPPACWPPTPGSRPTGTCSCSASVAPSAAAEAQ
jgi:hypothetical protein